MEPERLGAMLAERRRLLVALMLIGFGCSCSTLAAVSIDLLSRRPAPVVTPDIRPNTPTPIYITPRPWNTPTLYLTQTPEFTPTEDLKDDPLRITAVSGDTAGEIYQRLINNGHNPDKPVLYYPAEGGGPFWVTADTLPNLIYPGDIFVGQK